MLHDTLKRGCQYLLFDSFDTVPAPLQALLPQANPVIATTDGKNVAAQAPADSPNNGVKPQLGTCPA